MPDRTINFGESETEATYQIQDTDGAAGGGNFVVAKDTNANTVLLEYDPASDTWEYAGDVDMNGGNVSGVGTLTADSVNTKTAKTTDQAVVKANRCTTGSFSSGNWVDVVWDVEVEDNQDIYNPSTGAIDPDTTATYQIVAAVRITGTDGDALNIGLLKTGDSEPFRYLSISHGNSNNEALLGVFEEELQSNETYKIQVRDRNSSASTSSNATIEYLRITQKVEQ